MDISWMFVCVYKRYRYFFRFIFVRSMNDVLYYILYIQFIKKLMWIWIELLSWISSFKEENITVITQIISKEALFSFIKINKISIFLLNWGVSLVYVNWWWGMEWLHEWLMSLTNCWLFSSAVPCIKSADVTVTLSSLCCVHVNLSSCTQYTEDSEGKRERERKFTAQSYL